MQNVAEASSLREMRTGAVSGSAGAPRVCGHKKMM